MKAIFTLLFILFIGVAAQAQTELGDTKVETIEMGIITFAQSTEEVSFEKISLESDTEVARLYKFKNSRIKKALRFTTKRNKAKMA